MYVVQIWIDRFGFDLQMIFSLTAKKLMSYDSSNSSDKLRENFSAFGDGLIAFPLAIPGTAFYKCLQVHK